MLTFLDYSIIAVYFVAILAIGIWKGRKEENTEDFVVGGRKVPWLAVLGSLVATEVSAATFLGAPGTGYSQNLTYLQFGIGSILARFVVALFFLKAFYSSKYLSIYQYLVDRFGSGSHYTASLFFLLSRILASGCRLMIATMGFTVILDIPVLYALILFTAIALIYSASGGIKAVIYTDCVQAIVFIGAGLITLFYLTHHLGWDTIQTTGSEFNRFVLLKFQPEGDNLTWQAWFNDGTLLYIAILFGFISTTAAFGTDHDLTQRMLSCDKLKKAQTSIILSGFFAIPIAALFLTIGISLFVFYQINPDPALPEAARDVFPYFIKTVLPSGLKGILIVGVLAAAMSSLDSAMAALSSSCVVDLYQPLFRKGSSEKKLLLISRVFTALFAGLLMLTAWLLRNETDILYLSLRIAGIPYSALLGVFLLGIFTQRGHDKLNIIAMVAGALVTTLLLVLEKREVIEVAWPWLILTGTACTFIIGLCGRKKSTS